MRLASLLIAVSTLALPFNPVFAPTPVAAQQAPAPASPLTLCKGTVNVVRVSDIKPGMMDKFLQAAAAQQAWYKQAGTPDQIQVMRIMVQDPTSKAWSVSETQAITTHTTPNGPAKAAHDAAWDTFVAMFADSSTIKSTYLACMASM